MNTISRKALISLANASLLILSAAATQATVRSVPTTAYRTIQSAINAASSGDTIQVASGTYHESLSWQSKNLTITGAGQGKSILDPSTAHGGPGGGCLSTFELSSASRIDGFTFQNGFDSSNSGGMTNTNSNLMVTNCTFLNNQSGWSGGAMYNYGSNLIVTNCTFVGNSAPDGGGINNVSSNPTVVCCLFRSNQATGNGGGMYSSAGSYPNVTNCTFYGNVANDGGGICNDGYGVDTVTNCILWGNSAATGPSIFSQSNVTYSDVQGGYSGTGNVSADPLFVNASAGNFRLQAQSPCKQGNNAVVTSPPFLTVSGHCIDLDGNPRIYGLHVDMGAYECQANGVPTATAQSVMVHVSSGPNNITLTGSDPDGDTLTYTIVSYPLHGQLTGSGAAWTYRPQFNYHGMDSFTFRVTDPYGATSTAIVTITVQ